MHQELGRGTGQEGAHVAVDDERVGAVFLAADVLLQHPGCGGRDGHGGDVGVGLAHGAAGEQGHVPPVRIVDAHALEDVFFLRRHVEDFVDRGAGGDVVGFGDGEPELGGLLDEAVFLV